MKIRILVLDIHKATLKLQDSSVNMSLEVVLYAIQKSAEVQLACHPALDSRVAIYDWVCVACRHELGLMKSD